VVAKVFCMDTMEREVNINTEKVRKILNYKKMKGQ
jgi:hypothetical protein